jgi:15-cis-phytoene synthase
MTSSFQIFHQGSRTYFYSSLFFPPRVRQDIFTLYAFVRTIDDVVDEPIPNHDKYLQMKKTYHDSLMGKSADQGVIGNFAKLVKARELDQAWIDAFFQAMEMDLNGRVYHTLNDTIDYMYGSAEVIGFMMAKIMNLPEAAYPFAGLQGRAMQYINFIRDIKSDLELNRNYFPQNLLNEYNLDSLAFDKAYQNKSSFEAFISSQIHQYIVWQEEAEQGYKVIPKSCLIPIKTAADMYRWTAEVIRKDPFIVYQKKVKPSKYQIISAIVKNLMVL